ncbi:MAG: GAP family protein [Mycetocola sp.]
MVGVIGQLLPLMVATALSTVPILVSITILLAPRSTASAILYLIGLLSGSFLMTGLLAYGAQALPTFSVFGSGPTVATVSTVIGLAFIASGIVLFVRGGADSRIGMPRWLRAVGTIRPITALGLGLVLNIRPKALLLSTAAGLVIGTARLTDAEIVIVLAIFAIVGGSTVAVPIVVALARPQATRPHLQEAERWIVRHARAVTAVVLLLIGTIILGDGLSRF